MPTEMRTTRKVATAGRPWTSGSRRRAAALALVAASVLAWPVSAWASPGGVAAADAPATTTPALATTTTAAVATTTRPPTTTTRPTTSTTRPTTTPGPTGSASEKAARSAADGLRLADRPASSVPITVPPGDRLIDGQEVISIRSPWDGGSLDASTSQLVPFALGGLMLVFVFVQWLIDRRDPKFVEAPARKHEGSIGFE